MENFTKQQKIILIIILLTVLLIIIYKIINKTEKNGYIELESIYENTTLEEQEPIITSIKVHITGSVINPGIVEVREGARIADIIEKAGGTLQNADISKINLAFVVTDGQKIYIPSIYDNIEIEYITEEAGEKIIVEENSKTKKLVNINTATQEQLETLTGVGTATALKIIEYRKENGKFTTIEDIKEVPGIGEAKFKNLKDYICVK